MEGRGKDVIFLFYQFSLNHIFYDLSFNPLSVFKINFREIQFLRDLNSVMFSLDDPEEEFVFRSLWATSFMTLYGSPEGRILS